MRLRSRGAERARFEAVRRRFELWRGTRQGRGRIPEGLWTSAAKLAAVYGLCRTARMLRLGYHALKRRVEYAGLNESPAGPTPGRKVPARSTPAAKNPEPTTRIPKPPRQTPAMTFVELASAEHVGQSECLIELEHPRGAKMRIRLTGRQSPEIVTALSQVFIGAGP
ncbi:MAG: hypothetical protein V2A79_07950 [Planctomycetota bacterium]